MPTLTVIATLRAQPGKEAALKEQLSTLVLHTRLEAGCLYYELHRRQDDPAVFVMLERWADRAALDLHGTQPHMRAFGALLPQLLSGPVDMQLLDTVGADD